ncbi:MAG: pyridoxal 5-phosphate synthase pdxT subunit [Sphaerochaeta sp.]|jgi:5'-phosphate synthase pdxT subunit|nr:pyridoxal 5'-phosphate synthase glutaminase subunit PdxT [Spirochaetaceae bacterium]MDK2859530.1 pyridoxal 5-phosphate synthase pdxT subunit [Sphaerochaeta sp.]
MKVGVLALQGGFAEHVHALKRLGVSSFEIRGLQDLKTSMDALILPGGESTVMGRLLRELDLYCPLLDLIRQGMPVWGTCAGMILLANEVEGETETYFAVMPISVRRNAFGRQLGSFSSGGLFEGIGEIPMTFIRAPIIQSADKNVQVLATHDGFGVAARYDTMLVTAFHPELTSDTRVLQYFLGMAG